MRSGFPLVALLLQLMACATPPAATAPACHGQRRPANVFGSVLADAKAPASPAAATASAPPTPCAGAAR